MIELAEEDDELEEAERLQELERQETEAEAEEAVKAEEAARRAALEAERRKKEEEEEARRRDILNLQAYIDNLKRQIGESKAKLHEIRVVNKPKYDKREAARNAAKGTEADLNQRKKEYDEVLGGRLGQILGDFDFEAVNRAKEEKEMLMDEEDLRQQRIKENEAESLAHRTVRENLEATRQATLFS